VRSDGVRPGLAWHAVRGWAQRTDDDVARQVAQELGLPEPGAEELLEEEMEALGRSGATGSRSSKRARRDRIVYVDGHAVLRLNNYSLQGGEPSVFNSELGAQAPMAAPRAYAPSAGKRKKLKGAALKSKGKAPMSGDENARQGHNKMVDVARAALAPRRATFLEAHIAALEPFVSAATITHIRRMAAAAPKAGKAPPPPVHGPPAQITATLRPHQQEGLRWLSHMFHSGVNAILADEMGLGKTLQTICLLAHLKFDRKTGGPHLVVCPLSVLSSWVNELKRWCPALRVVRLHSSDEAERARLRREVVTDPSAFDVAVTTYDMVVSANFGQALTSKLHWRCLVLDEGHKAKNEATQVAQALRKVAVNAQYTLLLTGTPLQNNLRELWALLNLLHPDIFTDASPFDNAFKIGGKTHTIDAAALGRAHHLLRPFCLRRTKSEVEVSLPPKVETRVMCPLTEAQTFWYRRLLLKDSALLQRAEAGEGEGAGGASANGDWRRLQNLVMQLRTCCNHPFLFPGAHPERGVGAEELAAASGKLKVLDRLLSRLKASGHRVVLFSQFTSMLDILGEFLTLRGYAYARLDGSTNRVQRTVDIMQYNRPGSPLFVFLLSTKAGGLGVNLQSADTCILYDSDWNPQVDAQAMARVHRIGAYSPNAPLPSTHRPARCSHPRHTGQTKPVAVFRLVTAGTVEERMVQRAEKKLYLDTMVHRGGGGGGAGPSSTVVPGAEGAEGGAAEEEDGALDGNELLATLKFGADALFRSDAGAEPSEEELDALCDRSAGGDARRAALGEQRLDASAAKSVADFRGDGQPLSTFVLCGEDFTQQRAKAQQGGQDELAGIAAEFLERSQRERKSTTTMVDGFAVKRANMYSMEAGEPSVFQSETAAVEAPDAQQQQADDGKRHMERAGRDYPHADVCQVCWTDGTLYCCDQCPAAYHAECVGETAKALERANPWACPHHACSVCARKAAAAGGLLFRCECCASAFCEDHLPEDVITNGRIVGECARFQRLGQTHPAQACFIHCTLDCAEFAAAGFNGLDAPPPLAPGADAFDYVSQGAPWHEPGDDALLVPTPTGRIKQLPSASYSDLKNFLYGVRGSKFLVPVRGKVYVLEDIKIRDCTPALRDAITASVYAEVRTALQQGLAPERRPQAASQPAWNAPKFVPSVRREQAAAVQMAAGGLAPGALLPDRKRDRVCWTPEEEAALRSAVAAHGVEKWALVRSAAGAAIHPKRTAHDLKIKWRAMLAKAERNAASGGDAAEEEEEEDEQEASDAGEDEDEGRDGGPSDEPVQEVAMAAEEP